MGRSHASVHVKHFHMHSKEINKINGRARIFDFDAVYIHFARMFFFLALNNKTSERCYTVFFVH